MDKKTVVVNAFGGPGAGKTTAAWGIASELKKKGCLVEYVPEYAKELVWDGKYNLLDGSMIHEMEIYKEKKHRIERLIDKVDVIVTDSPTIQSITFLDEAKTSEQERNDFKEMAMKDWKRYDTFNFYIKRNSKEFEKEGRIHSLDESKKLDNDIKGLLDKNGIYYGTYEQGSLSKVAENIQAHLQKKQGTKQRIERKAYSSSFHDAEILEKYCEAKYQCYQSAINKQEHEIAIKKKNEVLNKIRESDIPTNIVYYADRFYENMDILQRYPHDAKEVVRTIVDHYNTKNMDFSEHAKHKEIKQEKAIKKLVDKSRTNGKERTSEVAI